MGNIIWFLCTIATIFLWSSACLLYKAGIHKDREYHTCLKYSASIGIVFYSYAMAIDSVSTDPILAVYPVFGIVAGSVLIIVDAMG